MAITFQGINPALLAAPQGFTSAQFQNEYAMGKRAGLDNQLLKMNIANAPAKAQQAANQDARLEQQNIRADAKGKNDQREADMVAYGQAAQGVIAANGDIAAMGRFINDIMPRGDMFDKAQEMLKNGDIDGLTSSANALLEAMNANKTGEPVNMQSSAGRSVIGKTASSREINGMMARTFNPVTGVTSMEFVPDVPGGWDQENDPLVSTVNTGRQGDFESMQALITQELARREEYKQTLITREEGNRGEKAEIRKKQSLYTGEAIDVVGNLPEMKRVMVLLGEIKTGGWEGVAVKAKAMMGIEAGDEGELVSLLGTSVIARLRSVFGAQFTEGEGDALKAVSAGMGASPETNIRLIGNTIKKMEIEIRRGLRYAQLAYRNTDDPYLKEGYQLEMDLINEGLAYDIGEDQPTAQSAQPAQQSGGYAEGTVKYSPTGESVTMTNGQWVPNQ